MRVLTMRACHGGTVLSNLVRPITRKTVNSFKEQDKIQITLNTCTRFIFCLMIASQRAELALCRLFFWGVGVCVRVVKAGLLLFQVPTMMACCVGDNISSY
eukprot:TRINITY_DN39083_c2_g2_i1.p1 TRINITY_DN39083_c2_g2~~TRINITY_DN39083_c2_g2_i1.p1  ORF type:complete len:101 (-),score=3.24 TRINITY_DN39083_c2_g2_i1:969-1271(-)